jgi:hypothetical protein
MRFRHLYLLLALAAFARATTVEPPSFPELVAEADSIYRGQVKSVEAHHVAAPGGESVIKTFVTFTVEHTLKGAAQAEVVLQFLGGTVGDDSLEVGGVPQFRVGQREILFVQKNGAQFCPLVRIMHGRYRIETEAATGRDFVARENRAPLADVSEVQLPMTEAPVAALRRTPAQGLSPAAFEASIASEVRAPTPQEKIR